MAEITTAEFRAQAEEARRDASCAVFYETRRTLLRIADDHDFLAELVERRKKPAK